MTAITTAGPTVTRIVKLGGEGGRYWRRIPARQLAEVDPAKATAALG